MSSRKAKLVAAGTVILALAAILLEVVPYLAVRSEKFEIVAQAKVDDPEAYISVTRSTATLSGYGAYQVVYSSDNLEERGYVSTFSDSLIMSMADISVTQANSGSSALVYLVKQGDCHVLAASGGAEPVRYEHAFYNRYLGSPRIPLKNGDRWEENIGGKSRCFGFDAPPP